MITFFKRMFGVCWWFLKRIFGVCYWEFHENTLRPRGMQFWYARGCAGFVFLDYHSDGGTASDYDFCPRCGRRVKVKK